MALPEKKSKLIVKAEPVSLLTSIQICLELQIIGYYKTFIEKKYKKQSFTKDEWVKKLKSDGVGL